MNGGAIFGVFLAVLFTGGIVALVIYARRQNKRSFGVAGPVNEQLTALFGEPTRYGAYGARDLKVGERTAKIVLIPGGKNSPPTLRVILPVEIRTAGAKVEHGAYRETARRRVKGQLPVLFRKETSKDRFGKSIGLNVEHHTQDTAFDDEVYIEGDASTEDLDALLSDATTRQAIHQILGMGYTSVELFRGAESVQASVTRPTAEVIEKTVEAANRLALIAENLPAFDSSPVGRAVPLRPALAATIGMVGGFGAFVFAVLSATRFNIVVPGAVLNLVLLGLGIWVPFCLLFFFLLRGRSDALRTFSFIFFSALFGIPSLVVGAGATWNGYLDTGVATSHDARITRRWITTSKNNKTHHLEVECWRPDTQRLEVTVSAALYGAVYEGGRIQIDTKPGHLGWEWISGMRAITPNPRSPVTFP